MHPGDLLLVPGIYSSLVCSTFVIPSNFKLRGLRAGTRSASRSAVFGFSLVEVGRGTETPKFRFLARHIYLSRVLSDCRTFFEKKQHPIAGVANVLFSPVATAAQQPIQSILISTMEYYCT